MMFFVCIFNVTSTKQAVLSNEKMIRNLLLVFSELCMLYEQLVETNYLMFASL